jgi:predicted  nucleic acid-binding Zn-ribbon protein
MAQGGTVNALMMAISTASQVSAVNPRWQDAQKQIQQWRSQVETVQDQPILDQADQYASSGDLNAVQAAIAQASQIPSGRALYGQAQARIRQWTNQIQTAQDQPLLDQARSYASTGNLNAAITTASQIRPGRALYDTAQKDVADWQSQIQAEADRVQAQVAEAQAQRTFQEARHLANAGNPAALSNAVNMAGQISSPGAIQTEINTAINQWSWQLLAIAREQAAGLNLAGAIAIAQTIPSRAEAYKEAQTQIDQWKKTNR